MCWKCLVRVCVCAAVAPDLQRLFPDYGVVDGGTSFLVVGPYEDRIVPVAIYFGQFEATAIELSVAKTFSADIYRYLHFIARADLVLGFGCQFHSFFCSGVKGRPIYGSVFGTFISRKI